MSCPSSRVSRCETSIQEWAQRDGAKTPVNVRIADNGGVYVDTLSVERVGLIAGAAGRVLDRKGLTQPYYYEPEQVDIKTTPQRNRVEITTPDIQVRVRTDGYVGRPSTLSKKEQLKQAWRFARG